jgi:hypothetical protein
MKTRLFLSLLFTTGVAALALAGASAGAAGITFAAGKTVAGTGVFRVAPEKLDPALPRTGPFRCVFNHELLIVAGRKDNSAAYIQSFIDKLADTDVDAVTCCPTAYRTNLFPSEVDPTWKAYTPGNPPEKMPSYDYIMAYLHAGGDPVRDTLEACRRAGKSFLVSYRMNDHHNVNDRDFPTHNAIWREHPEYWMGDSNDPASASNDNVRLFNYMVPGVRDYYFGILRELCTNYDVDGVELDFQRYPKFFRAADLEAGRAVMTAFVRRIREMMDGIGRARGKSLSLCARVPETLAKCAAAGLDIPGWDAEGLLDLVNISSSYYQTIELGVEGFKAAVHHARLYGEMNYVTTQLNLPDGGYARRYTPVPMYRAAALNLLSRGVDGLSFFNYDYVPSAQRLPMTEGLRRITDAAFLREADKDYAVYPNFGTFPARNEKTVTLLIPDDTAQTRFARAILRVETKADCAALDIAATLNGRALEPLERADTELFPPVDQNASYPPRGRLKFYAVPLDALICGQNTLLLKNTNLSAGACDFFSLELALYRE